MQLSALVAVVASASLAIAEIGGILMCTGANSTGTCKYDVYDLSTCQDLPDSFFENTATFAPDGEPFYCYPRVGHCSDICTSPEGCTLGPVSFGYANKENLTAVEWNTLIGSFTCHNGTADGLSGAGRK